MRKIILSVTVLLCFVMLQNVSAQWQVTTGPTSPNVISLCNNAADLFAAAGGTVGVSGGEVALTSNNGTNWAIVNNGLIGHIYALAFKGTDVFAGADGGAVFQTSNNGTNWTNTSTGLPAYDVRAITVDGNNIYAGDNGVYKSTNNGLLWTSITSWNSVVVSIAVSGTTILAATLSNGIYMSANGGSTWNTINTGLPSQVNSVIIYGTTFLAGTNTGLYISTNSGGSWSVTNVPDAIFSFTVIGNNLFAASSSGAGVFQSINGGTVWSTINAGLTNLTVYSLAHNATYLFAGTTGYVWRRLISEVFICTPTSATITQNSCNSYTSPSGNYTWTTSGIHLDTIPNAGGCDSTLTINLTINTVNNSVTQSGATLTASAIGATYQWLDCDNSFAIINGATSQTFTATANGNYAVAISQNGCSDTSSCFAITGVGVNEINSENNFEIFPNPSDGDVIVQQSELNKNCRVIISNQLGQELFSENLNQKSQLLNLKSFSQGIYFVKVEMENGSVVMKKIIKE